jgi:hypothetical protein
MKPAPSTNGTQWTSIKCKECGKTCGQYLQHYDRVRCTCGQYYWALQPKRNGPYKLYPWAPPIYAPKS